MVKHECSNCFKIFNHKGNYEKHIKCAKPCKINNPCKSIVNPLYTKTDLVINDMQCCCCLKLFVNKNSRIRHEKTSKCFYEKTKADDEKENMRIKLIEDKNRKLEEKLLELEQMIKQGINPVALTTSINNKINCDHKMIYKKNKISHCMKRQVWATHVGDDIGKITCLCCKLTDITQLTFICGHIISESQGGDISIGNLLPICNSCNLSMGTKNLNDYMKNNGLEETL